MLIVCSARACEASNACQEAEPLRRPPERPALEHDFVPVPERHRPSPQGHERDEGAEGQPDLFGSKECRQGAEAEEESDGEKREAPGAALVFHTSQGSLRECKEVRRNPERKEKDFRDRGGPNVPAQAARIE